MNVGGARKFRISTRSLMLIVGLFAFLMASLFWNIRQYRLIEQERQQALAAEREKAARVKAEEAEQNQARIKKNADWASSDARVQQLYREIDSLTRVNEHVLAQPLPGQNTPEKTSAVVVIDGTQ
jgi:hypothetical protein